jgi:spore germination cell wall hydrolase CwlJ-like protein
MNVKKIAALLLSALLALAAAIPAAAEYDPEVNYMERMISAAVSGDVAAGAAAEKSRNEKIDAVCPEIAKISYTDLCLLAKIIYAEAGSEWLPDEWKFCVGEVVMNRVASPEFPDTVAAVLAQPGQYYGPHSRYFQSIRPDARHLAIAARLLGGERHMVPSVVFQANFPQGGGTYLRLTDRVLGNTYLCFSSRPALY